MEKRLPLALFLSFLVFMAWSVLGPRDEVGPPSSELADELGAQDGAQAEAPEPPPAPVSDPIAAEAELPLLELELGHPGEPGHYHAVFSNRGARLVELRIGNYYDRSDLTPEERADPEHWVQLLAPFGTPRGLTGSLELAANASAEELLRGTPLEEALWTMTPVEVEGTPVGVDFVYDPGSGVAFHKRVRFVPGRYAVQVVLGLENRGSPLAGERSFRFTPANVVPRSSEDNFYVEPLAVAAWRSTANADADLSSEERKDAPGSDLSGPLGGSGLFSFGGVQSKYFAFLAHPDPRDQHAVRAVQGARYRRLFDAEWGRGRPPGEKGGWNQIVCDLDLSLYLPEQGAAAEFRSFELFAGPKDHDALVASWSDHQELIDEDLGMFRSVSKVILGILGLYEGLVGNWGWAIILMTLTVRLLLFPINRRSQTAMARYQSKMKRLQPKLEELKKRFEKDPQKLRQEQARFMQEEGAFPPLGGCLPIFLQMPVFIGLFQALRVDFDLRHAPFLLWIQDLSMPDRLMTLGITGLPLAGDMLEYLNVLPILMIVLWILQQRAMPTPTDEQQARMQKMMMWMPILFGVFLYNYAAGLSLYMITSSSLGIFEMRVIKKLWPVDDTELQRKPSGFMARLAEMQKEQMRRMEQAQRGGGSGRGGGGRGGRGGKGKKGKPVG